MSLQACLLRGLSFRQLLQKQSLTHQSKEPCPSVTEPKPRSQPTGRSLVKSNASPAQTARMATGRRRQDLPCRSGALSCLAHRMRDVGQHGSPRYGKLSGARLFGFGGWGKLQGSSIQMPRRLDAEDADDRGGHIEDAGIECNDLAVREEDALRVAGI